MTSSSVRLLLGTHKGLLILERGNGGWETAHEAFIGVPVPYAFTDPRSGTVWASLDHGHWGRKLSRSTDGGATWDEVPAPTYPDGSEIKPGVPASTLYIWSLAAGGAHEPERLYAGTEPGGLFRSDDGGDSWQLVDSLWNHPSRTGWFGGGRNNAGIHSILVDPRDSRHVYVGVSCAGVFETKDDGASWAPMNKNVRTDFLPNPLSEVGSDPHCVVACPSHPAAMWQQNHCGIFRTTDGAASWTDVSEPDGLARFGFAVAVDAENPDVAWVVPAQADEKRV
ncbi:glycosyl hydrolase, partial [Candidatus Poribacteria bacterium]|nr:glycosyl hydrolase [Candidatus Poribacteria bacterium]